MPKPLIGITTRNGNDRDLHPTVVIQHAYINAIVQAGGVGIPIPSNLPQDSLTRFFTGLDGILFSGGGDIALDHFDGSPHARVEGVDSMRDAAELFLLRAAIREKKPVLGICRGCQLFNVGLGGTLYTHLSDQYPNALKHDYPGSNRTLLAHEVKIESGTRLGDLLGEPMLKVNSHHHQGLKDIAAGLKIAGYASDGLVEAIELADYPFGVAVQWHPEWLTDQVVTQNLFRCFVEACG